MDELAGGKMYGWVYRLMDGFIDDGWMDLDGQLDLWVDGGLSNRWMGFMVGRTLSIYRFNVCIFPPRLNLIN